MVGGKGVLMAMMVDNNAEEVKKKLGGKILQDSVQIKRVVFCVCLDCVGDGPIIIYL